MTKPLRRLEVWAQKLVEGSLGRFLGSKLDLRLVSAELRHALLENSEHSLAPTQYNITIHPDDLRELKSTTPELESRLIAYIMETTQTEGFSLAELPQISWSPSTDQARQQIQIAANLSNTPTEMTQSMLIPPSQSAESEQVRPIEAFLILAGGEHTPLNQQQITIGRASDCDLIINDRAISRHHAQLRWQFSRWMLYDLGSRGGSFINNQPIQASTLQSGDVIRLSHITLIYGEEAKVKNEQHDGESSRSLNQHTHSLPRL